MGRSQVKYNQKHGRPGTKGRGGGRRGRGGDGESTNKRQQPLQGDNAWRFQDAADTQSANYNNMNTEILDLASEKPYHSGSTPAVVEQEDSLAIVGGRSRIDVSAMGKALNRLSVSERLGIPSYLTVDLEVQKGVKGDSNLSEMTVTGDSTISTGEIEDAEEAKSQAGEEDDLDAWLDTVIT